MTWADMTVEQRRQAVKDAAASGMTGSQIAAALGTTKNSVVGVAYRGGIQLPGWRKSVPAPKPVREKKPPVEKKPKGLPAHKLIGNKSSKEVRTISLAAPTSAPVPFIEAVDRGLCKWPLWDRFEHADVSMCCGADRVVGRPYCAFHEHLHHGQGTPSERAAEKILLKEAMK